MTQRFGAEKWVPGEQIRGVFFVEEGDVLLIADPVTFQLVLPAVKGSQFRGRNMRRSLREKIPNNIQRTHEPGRGTAEYADKQQEASTSTPLFGFDHPTDLSTSGPVYRTFCQA